MTPELSLEKLGVISAGESERRAISVPESSRSAAKTTLGYHRGRPHPFCDRAAFGKVTVGRRNRVQWLAALFGLSGDGESDTNFPAVSDNSNQPTSPRPHATPNLARKTAMAGGCWPGFGECGRGAQDEGNRDEFLARRTVTTYERGYDDPSPMNETTKGAGAELLPRESPALKCALRRIAEEGGGSSRDSGRHRFMDATSLSA